MRYPSGHYAAHRRNLTGSDAVRAGRDRWLLSYADLVTLLFACFTTAYAATQATAESRPSPESLIPPVVVESPQSAKTAPPSVHDLVAPIIAALGNTTVELGEDERGVVITLPESASFPTGSATLTDEAKSFLSTLADKLRSTGASLRIEGHTDDVPLAGGRYGTNWELSTARASAVVLFLISDAAFPAQRLSAAGYGEFRPREVNDTPEHRALNRRVDVVVVGATEVEPQ